MIRDLDKIPLSLLKLQKCKIKLIFSYNCSNAKKKMTEKNPIYLIKIYDKLAKNLKRN